jgi:hypothetical protein
MLKLNPGSVDLEVFINIQITSAGVNVRAAVAWWVSSLPQTDLRSSDMN